MSLFYDFKHSEVVEKVTMKWPSDDYIIPAGTPMSRTGIANNGDAIGILASEARVQFDFPLSVAKYIGKKEPKGNKDFTFEIITGGFVNLTDAESAFGEKYTDEAKAAMSGISFVDESGEGMGGGASSWNDLKDKPFGEEVTEGVILETELADGMAQLEMVVELAEGKTYTVNLDSGSVQAVCKVFSMNGMSLHYLGNLALMIPELGDNDTGETFVVATSPEQMMCAVMDTNGGSKASVTGEMTVVHTIDPKYVPDDYDLIFVCNNNYINSDYINVMSGDVIKTYDKVRNFQPVKVALFHVMNGDYVIGRSVSMCPCLRAEVKQTEQDGEVLDELSVNIRAYHYQYGSDYDYVIRCYVDAGGNITIEAYG